jgi:hypothetical protein
MHVIHGVLVVGEPTVRVVVIGPALTQLDTCDPLVPSKVCSIGPVSDVWAYPLDAASPSKPRK